MENPCPICRAAVTARRPANPDYPFCSARCRTIDLGRWIDESYRIPAQDQAPSEGDTVPVAPASWEA